MFFSHTKYLNDGCDKFVLDLRYELYKNENGIVCYTPVGYATVYEYFAYPDKIRPRISQMLILPPFQRKGLCAKLLNSIYKHYCTNSNVINITGNLYLFCMFINYQIVLYIFNCVLLLVESPNDEFQLVRDFVDVINFRSLKTFDKEKLKTYHYQEMIEEFKTLFKVNQVYYLYI